MIPLFCLALGAQAQPLNLFNGTDLTQWLGLYPNSQWEVCGTVTLDPDNNKIFSITPGEGVMVNGKRGSTVNILSTQKFGDCQLHIEFVVPQGSNSGVYLQSLYEIQVFDSFGKEQVSSSDCGGVYQRWDEQNNKPVDEGHAPRVNASKAPGEWQSYDITFRAPRFKDGEKVENARFVLVVHNGVIVHENIDLPGPTRAFNAKQEETEKAPLMLQGDHGPVAYRNIRVVPLNLP
jgi:hypothetical protein